MSIFAALRRRLRHRALLIAALTLALLLLAYPLAGASDVLSNVAPASQLPSGSLANSYPLGNYALDHHFDAVSAGVLSGVDVSGLPPTIAWFLAQMIWMVTAFLANALITLFTFAFSLDLVNGSSTTGGAGALAPVGDAVRSIYRETFGAPWLVVSILLSGMWAMWHALVRRRYTETAGALGLSLVFVVIALAFVSRPEIIGQASRWTNQMSGAFLALSHNGSITGESQAKQAAADQLFGVLIHEPWAVLDFGGLEHCVTGSGDHQRSVPVRPLSHDASRDAALSRRLATGTQVQADGKDCINNRNKYAAHFLAFAPESDERNAEYDALNDGDTGKLPDTDAAKTDGSYRLGEIDKPAAEAMGKGGQYQRLLLALVIFLGELGAFLLLGAVSVSVILAQVLLLLLLAFAPVALVVGVFPGRGHEFFIGWLSRLGSYLLRKAIYSLLLAVLLAVAAALEDATSSLGWLMAFGLQGVFYWTVLLNRRQLVGQLNRATTGHTSAEGDGIGKAAVLGYAAARLATRRRPAPPRPAPHGGTSDAPVSNETQATPPPDGGDQDGSAGRPDPGPAAPPDPTGHAPEPAGAAPGPAPEPAGTPPEPQRTSPDRAAPDAAAPIEPAEPVRSDEAAETAPAPSVDAHAAPDLPAPRERSTTAETPQPPARERETDIPDQAATPVRPKSSSTTGTGSREHERERDAVRRESPLRRGLDDDAHRFDQRPASPAPELTPEPSSAPQPSDATVTPASPAPIVDPFGDRGKS